MRTLNIACFHHIQDLWRICHYLDLNSAKLIANALVSRCHDYCNSLLSDIADTDLTKLKRVQNRLARVVTMSINQTSISPTSLAKPGSVARHYLIAVFHCYAPFIGYQ